MQGTGAKTAAPVLKVVTVTGSMSTLCAPLLLMLPHRKLTTVSLGELGLGSPLAMDHYLTMQNPTAIVGGDQGRHTQLSRHAADVVAHHQVGPASAPLALSATGQPVV
jgi:hypothetical protein